MREASQPESSSVSKSHPQNLDWPPSSLVANMRKHLKEPEGSLGEPAGSLGLCLSVPRAGPPKRTNTGVPCSAGPGTAARTGSALCLSPAWEGSCEFHRDCPRRTSICLLVPCLFLFPRGSVPRGPAAMLCGRGLCGAANRPGAGRKLLQPGRLPSLAFSPWFPAVFCLLVPNSLSPHFPSPTVTWGSVLWQSAWEFSMG